MVFLSAGIASTNIILVDPTLYKFGGNLGIIYERARCISFPIELKAFLLARNGVGIGIYISKNIRRLNILLFLPVFVLLRAFGTRLKIRSNLYVR